VTEWFEGKASLEAIDRVPGLGLNVRMQERAAKALREARMARGAIDFESKETKPRLGLDGELHIEPERSDRAKEFIAECMIAANGAVARFIKARGLPTLRRVVRVPKRWSRIVALAAEREYRLAEEPDPKALADFLTTQRARDPEGFPSLSLATMKLMGAGEYVAQYQGEPDHGHFALATREYAHSTAPNRRYPDVATQRLLMAAFGGTASPFLDGELDDIARECTDGMNRAAKIERQVDKAAVAMVLESRIGEEFDAMVTGAAEKGTWVKVLDFEAEGRLARGFAKVDVGDTVRVKLHSVDVDKGHIDFVRA
jgi:exoribonuclease-2